MRWTRCGNPGSQMSTSPSSPVVKVRRRSGPKRQVPPSSPPPCRSAPTLPATLLSPPRCENGPRLLEACCSPGWHQPPHCGCLTLPPVTPSCLQQDVPLHRWVGWVWRMGPCPEGGNGLEHSRRHASWLQQDAPQDWHACSQCALPRAPRAPSLFPCTESPPPPHPNHAGVTQYKKTLRWEAHIW